jgi:branched-chain amino acid transport system ATP-binding protein
MTELLSLNNVSAGYGATVVLEHVSLSVDTGTTLAVLGRNGVGKTTLLATIVGHTTRHDGSVTFSGRSIEHLKPYRRARLGIGTVPQEREIFPSLTVEENLTVAARGAGNNNARGAGNNNARGADGWTLERVYALFPNLAERRRGMGNQLSGGEQQMLAIARALMGNPSLLLLDEPLEGLAPVIVDRLLEALQHLRSSAHLTMILTEQQARLALEFSDHAVILDRGRIVHAAPAADLLADPQRLSALIGVAR